MALGISSCGAVTNLESITIRDGAMWSSYRITTEGDVVTIGTRSSRAESMDERTYPFSQEQRRDIEQILNRNGLLQHGDYYKPLLGRIYDGETLFIHVQFDGQEKEIFCDNNIPAGLTRIPEQIVFYYQKQLLPLSR